MARTKFSELRDASWRSPVLPSGSSCRASRRSRRSVSTSFDTAKPSARLSWPDVSMSPRGRSPSLSILRTCVSRRCAGIWKRSVHASNSLRCSTTTLAACRCTSARAQQPDQSAAQYVPSMYQHNGKQRYTEGNSGQHEMRSDQVKSLLPGTPQQFGIGLITRRLWRATTSIRGQLMSGRVVIHLGRLAGAGTRSGRLPGLNSAVLTMALLFARLSLALRNGGTPPLAPGQHR